MIGGNSTPHIYLPNVSKHASCRYVYPSEIQTFGSVEARQKFLATGRIGRAWATNYTTASRLPLHPSIGPPNTPYPPPSSLAQHFEKDDDDEAGHSHFFDDASADAHGLGPLSHSALSFVHGGLSPSYSGLSPFPSRINDLSTSLLQKLQNREQPPPHPPHPYPGLPAGT